MLNENLTRRTCDLCRREHYVRIDRTEASNSCFTSLMGHTEMECALAVIVNKARRSGCRVADARFCRDEFSPDGYERDGFDELIAYGWISEVTAGIYQAGQELLRRLHSRIPNA